MTTTRRRQRRKPTSIPAARSVTSSTGALPGFLSDVDGRYAAARFAKDTFAELCNALGGVETVTPQERMLIENAVWAHARLRELTTEYATGKGLDADEFSTYSTVLSKALRTLGMKRVAKRVPSLRELLDSEGGE
jgi:hypothetical protein